MKAYSKSSSWRTCLGIRPFIAIIAFMVLLPGSQSAQAQVRSGVGYLKLLPGARQFGIAGAQTGMLDYANSFYANPAATGLLREWQWSANYTNWISDLYNASLLYGRKIRMPWSQRTRVAIGINYLGIPEFDSSDRISPSVSGNDLLIAASIGQPLGTLSERFSLGANLKYFRSELAQYAAASWMVDLGLLYRTPRLNFLTPGDGFGDYAIFSAGLAITNLGPAIKFVNEGTPLPRTLRAGVALNIGASQGLQLSLASDYHQIRDEDGFVVVGTEISWRQWVTLRGGYNFENNLLGSFTFGASFRFDDHLTPVKAVLPGRNNALRFDLAARQNSDFVSSPYDGSITHYPIGPEPFALTSPLYGARVGADSVRLAWQPSRDPDLFDDLRYWLLVERDSLKLAQLLEMAEADEQGFITRLPEQQLLISEQLDRWQHELQDVTSGNYYWSVLAYDQDDHVRFGEMGGRRLASFYVTGTNLQITAIAFVPSPWITRDDLQGELKVTVVNHGDRTASGHTLLLQDSSLAATDGDFVHDDAKVLLARLALPAMSPGSSQTLPIEWRTGIPGLHSIRAAITAFDHKTQREEIRHALVASFYTIPKGALSLPDTVIARVYTTITYELPLVGKIYFDSSQTEVKPEFIRRWFIEPPLHTLATRLTENNSLSISLRGTADPNSGESDVTLADARAAAIRDSLQQFGANPEQIAIVPGEVLPLRKLPADPDDARWLLQERRRVDITTATENEMVLFGPSQVIYKDTSDSPVTFNFDIASAMPLRFGHLSVGNSALNDTAYLSDALLNNGLRGELKWSPVPDSRYDHRWLDNLAAYQLLVEDSLARRFATPPQNVFLRIQYIFRERMYFGVARFAVAEPFYNFYWDNLLDRIPLMLADPHTRLRFIGHACAIGSEPINQSLSQKRAELFYQRVLRDLQERNPEYFQQVKNRIDPPEGFGETRPFEIKKEDGTTIRLGDNQTPLGRQLNRRVIALFYTQK